MGWVVQPSNKRGSFFPGVYDSPAPSKGWVRLKIEKAKSAIAGIFEKIFGSSDISTEEFNPPRRKTKKLHSEVWEAAKSCRASLKGMQAIVNSLGRQR